MTSVSRADRADVEAIDHDGTIIVVDDDPAIRKSLDRMLSLSGFGVETYPTSEAMLASGATGRGDCFVLDLRLPGMSGFALHDEMVKAGIDAPVVFITGQETRVARETAAAHGAAGFLVKPFEGATLVSAITGSLGKSD